ncbi:unnamed protein product [Gongylonema pulchrum]|uniref:HAD family phosphatase n=1 Tax=Gongylonema pulchrum TaxID=637853 RepID=A0A183D029_9BILA|nr:unnamed protein product [Gongylonema pulchrum]
MPSPVYEFNPYGRLSVCYEKAKILVLSGDDPAIKRGKPAPDPFLVTMDRFKDRPEKAANVLVFEDAANGVRAALAAGMPVVMIPDLTYMKVPEDIRHKISQILKSLEEFKPETMGLPAYNHRNSSG